MHDTCTIAHLPMINEKNTVSGIRLTEYINNLQSEANKY